MVLEQRQECGAEIRFVRANIFLSPPHSQTMNRELVCAYRYSQPRSFAKSRKCFRPTLESVEIASIYVD